MTANAKTQPSLGLAVIMGALALGALSLPPIEVVQRADRALFDWWTRTAAPRAPHEIIIVNVDDPTWAADVADIAREQGSRLLITSLVMPFTASGSSTELGPVAIAPAGSQFLRETDWDRGGYLWPQPDFDGVVRNERPLVDTGVAVPSLALAGSIWLQRADQSALGQYEIVANSTPLSVDTEGRRWLRYYDPATFREATHEEILAQPELLAGKIVIVGQSGTPRHATPVGALTDQELLAQQFAGYWRGSAITTEPQGRTIAWGLTGLLLVMIVVLPLSLAWSAALPFLGTTALLAGGTGAFFSSALWYPIAGPALLALIGGSCSMWAHSRHIASKKTAATADPSFTSESPATTALPAGEQPLTAEPPPEIEQSLPPESDHEPELATLGRYQLLKKIGRGAMGLVYLGRDPKINRKVAIKTMDLAEEFEIDDIEEVRERFLLEAETAGGLSHPDIVTIYDAGEENNVAYIAMELLRGRHLSDHTKPSRLLPATTVLKLISRAARALDYAHQHNVVHRDIKPANIMYDSGTDSLKLTDFGIARLMDVSRTRTGIVLGTPSFMSPEQLEGKNVKGHTDLFALGVSLYQLLTGHLPFRGNSMTELMFVIANEPHKPVTSIRADLPSSIDAVMDKALAKNPGDRFATGIEMAHALREVAAQAT
jgi:hypothetical protein